MPDPFDEIYQLSRVGQYDAALAKLLGEDRAQLSAPYDSDLNHGWYVVGDVFYKKGEFRSAAEAFDKAIADRPDDHEALMALANCYFGLSMPEMAERYLRVALNFSDDPALIYNLGNALFDQGRNEEALAEYRRIPETAGEIYSRARKNIRAAQNATETGS
jgi:tetratricopeptide (TPR) repeat protein